MAFDLTIGTERAQALQNAIQDELQKRGFTPDPDPTMAEYITIMLINNKTSEQITAELEDLIGSGEYDPSFTDWLFTEAAAKSESAVEATPTPAAPQQAVPHVPESQARSIAPIRSTPIYSQALNQALPSGSSTGQKRTASARSSSPPGGHPNKARRMDLPTGPRAMHGGQGNRSLLDRMGGRTQGGQRNPRDEIQARIEAVTHQNAMAAGQMPPGFNGMNGMNMSGPEMNAFAQGMNPLALQEMMMNQMALMAQMANNMGMLNGQNPMMNPNGFQPNANMQMSDGQGQGQQGNNRRGGGPTRGRGRGGSSSQASHRPEQQSTNVPSATVTPTAFAAPTPTPAQAPAAPLPAGFTAPGRPQSPSLCKFGLKCTNAMCRFSHASPVATPESGVVLSNDPCEAGINCVDKDCVKAHVSPAAKGIATVSQKITPKGEVTPALKPPCRYGANCTKVASGNCPFSHPFVPKTFGAAAVPCRFGAACTRGDCHFQHPAGRVLPNTFHRGLTESGPTVSVKTPQTGTMERPSPHRTVIFNKPGLAGDKSKENNAGGENATVEAAA